MSWPSFSVCDASCFLRRVLSLSNLPLTKTSVPNLRQKESFCHILWISFSCVLYHHQSPYHINLPALCLEVGYDAGVYLGEPVFCAVVFKTYSEVNPTQEINVIYIDYIWEIYHVPPPHTTHKNHPFLFHNIVNFILKWCAASSRGGRFSSRGHVRIALVRSQLLTEECRESTPSIVYSVIWTGWDFDLASFFTDVRILHLDHWHAQKEEQLLFMSMPSICINPFNFCFPSGCWRTYVLPEWLLISVVMAVILRLFLGPFASAILAYYNHLGH